MSNVHENPAPSTDNSSSRWHALADAAVAGRALSPDDALAVLDSPDEQLLDLLAAAYRVRHRHFGNRVRLNFLLNAKSGHCGEDCGYCSQSRVSQAQIETYDLVQPEKILDGARAAHQRGARTYCTVISGRSPRPHDLEVLEQVVPEIKRRWKLKVCFSPGLLTTEQAARLKACGVDRINHNLNTSRRFYPHICTTHDYQQRLDTLEAVRAADMEICSGVLLGMGEEKADVVEMALTCGRLAVDALPVNFLLPIAGIALGDLPAPSPRDCLRALALFRLASPKSELRVAAGREKHLGPLQPLALYPANSIFVGDYLTTAGQPPEDDYRMIEALGFEIEKSDA